jgi:nanoRNase/pAp phosphatase (c-di-AMP/oligoRNAs hydrolase)
VAASATIVAAYLREQHVSPGRKLASAMIYAIRTETRGSEVRHSRLDRSVLTWLTQRANPTLVAEIENAPLSMDYYGDLVLAMQNTFLYGDVAFCLLPRAKGAEIVGEVADLLIRGEKIRRVLCGAVIGTDVVFSARTDPHGGDASQLLRSTLAGLGAGGGHERRAGGKTPRIAVKGRITERLYDQIRTRWLEACGVDRMGEARLISKSEIIEHL